MWFDELEMSDGHILEVHYSSDRLVVIFKDWRERCWDIVFCEIDALQAFSPEGTEVEGAILDDENPLMVMARESTKEDLQESHCFSFISVWDDTKVLSVVTRSVEVNRR